MSRTLRAPRGNKREPGGSQGGPAGSQGERMVRGRGIGSVGGWVGVWVGGVGGPGVGVQGNVEMISTLVVGLS